MEYYLVLNKNRVKFFLKKWIDFKCIRLSEVIIFLKWKNKKKFCIFFFICWMNLVSNIGKYINKYIYGYRRIGRKR